METKPTNRFVNIARVLKLSLAIIFTILAISYAVYNFITYDYRIKHENLTYPKVDKDYTENKFNEIDKKLLYFNNLFKENEANKGNIIINNKLKKLEQQIANINERTLALRQAINPIKPEEVITIARLRDEIMVLKDKVDKIPDELKKENDNFRIAVLREIDAAGKSTNYIWLVLIPLVLNLMWSVFKDIREEKKDKTNSPK